jgi:DNA-binding CsgD family transcriptional regulator
MKNTTATDGLTRRQIQTLRLIADGYTNRQIAGLLSIKLKTVEKHRQSLMDKLDIHQVANFTRYAVSNGIVEVNWPPRWTLAGFFGQKGGRKCGGLSWLAKWPGQWERKWARGEFAQQQPVLD